MAEVTFHRVGEAEQSDFTWAYSTVYRQGQVPEAPEDQVPFHDGHHRFIARVDGKVAACYRVWPFRVSRGQAALTQGGIAAVGVMPEYRRLGIGTRMMDWSLGQMRQDGFLTASLYAFRESFYRRSGYELTGRRWNLKCPSGRLPNTPAELEARRIMPEEAAAVLGPCLERFAKQRSGVNYRTPAQWVNRLGRTKPMIYAVGDPVEAYCWVTTNGFWETVNASEVTWSTRRGYLSLMAFLRSLCINQSDLVWDEPSDGLFLQEFSDEGLEVKLYRPMMARVLDVPAALTRLKPQESGEFRLSITDRQMPDNNGPWHVRFGPEGVDVSSCDEVDLSMPIEVFSPAFFGEPSLEQLTGNGRVTSFSENAYRAACRLLTPSPTINTEFF